MKKKIFYLSLVVTISFAIFLTGTVLATEAIPENSKNTEEVEIVTPIEMSDKEVEMEIKKLLKPPPGYIVKLKYDLHNPNGIDKTLLPEDYVKYIPEGQKVTDYREWEFVPVDREKIKLSAEIIEPNLSGDDCPVTYEGVAESTMPSSYSGITQYSRYVASKYRGQEIGNYFKINYIYGKWTRSSSSYSVYFCRIGAYVWGEQCNGTYRRFPRDSSEFDPTWYGNSTNWWRITGGYSYELVSWPGGQTRTYTESDVYKNGNCIKYDFITRNFLPLGYYY